MLFSHPYWLSQQNPLIFQAIIFLSVLLPKQGKGLTPQSHPFLWTSKRLFSVSFLSFLTFHSFHPSYQMFPIFQTSVAIMCFCMYPCGSEQCISQSMMQPGFPWFQPSQHPPPHVEVNVPSTYKAQSQKFYQISFITSFKCLKLSTLSLKLVFSLPIAPWILCSVKQRANSHSIVRNLVMDALSKLPLEG